MSQFKKYDLIQTFMTHALGMDVEPNYHSKRIIPFTFKEERSSWETSFYFKDITDGAVLLTVSEERENLDTFFYFDKIFVERYKQEIMETVQDYKEKEVELKIDNYVKRIISDE